MKSSASQLLRCRRIAALVVPVALLAVPSLASASSQAVLEFVPAGGTFPVAFTATAGKVTVEEKGALAMECTGSSSKGEITGALTSIVESTYTGCSALGGFVTCQSKGAAAGEIKGGPLESELVYIDKAKQEVGDVLNPRGGTYITYECEGRTIEGMGSIISSIEPVNRATTSFTQIFKRSGASQIPTEYENANGERLKATPTGSLEGGSAAETGTEATDVTKSAEVEVKDEVLEKHEEKQEEGSSGKKKQEEEAAAAAAKKRQEEEAAAKRHQEEEAANKAQSAVAGSVALDGTAIAVLRTGAAPIKLTCTGHGTCAGKLTLTAKGKAKKGKKAKTETIGTAGFSIPPGKTATVRIALTAAGRALLEAGGARPGSLLAILTILKSSPAPSQTSAATVHLAEKATGAKKKTKR